MRVVHKFFFYKYIKNNKKSYKLIIKAKGGSINYRFFMLIDLPLSYSYFKF